MESSSKGNAMTIREMWEELALETLSVDAGPIQRKECRRYFYAGCVAMLYYAANVAADKSEEDAAAQLEAWNEELAKFGRDIEKELV